MRTAHCPPRCSHCYRSDVPIWLELEKLQLDTVVVEDAQGVRVRTVVAEMLLPAGKNGLSWNGYDDGTRNVQGDLVRTLVPPASTHALCILYFQRDFGAEFEVRWSDPGVPDQPIPAAAFSHAL